MTADKRPRELGFYWVRYRDRFSPSGWSKPVVAEWGKQYGTDGPHWLFVDSEVPEPDDERTQVLSARLPPPQVPDRIDPETDATG